MSPRTPFNPDLTPINWAHTHNHAVHGENETWVGWLQLRNETIWMTALEQPFPETDVIERRLNKDGSRLEWSCHRRRGGIQHRGTFTLSVHQENVFPHFRLLRMLRINNNYITFFCFIVYFVLQVGLSINLSGANQPPAVSTHESPVFQHLTNRCFKLKSQWNEIMNKIKGPQTFQSFVSPSFIQGKVAFNNNYK